MVPFAGSEYWLFLAVLVFGRGADLLSTWIATPRLVLEGNPIARRLGWKVGLGVNGLACGLCAFWPFAAVIIATTSALVATRNFQSAWLMRHMGEMAYRDWHLDHILSVPLGLYLACLAAQTILMSALGGVLLFTAAADSIPFAVGWGVLTYAAAVAIYTSLAIWRARR
jgi:hypothetical protein